MNRLRRSVGSKGDSYDNALAESVIGLYKTEVIRKRATCRRSQEAYYRREKTSEVLTTLNTGALR